MKAKTKWVDFAELKQRVGMKDILEHYELPEGLTERKNNELVGYCPIHDENQYNKNSFCVNTEKNVFNCFACGAHGNILDFVAQMEDVDIRKAGLLIQEWFNLTPAKKLARKEKPDRPPVKPEKTAAGSETPDSGAAAVNPPLTFELKDLDQNHPYLKERGLEKETIKEFGIGFCKRGLMKDRIAIPIHNTDGELVAYAGRWPGEPPDGEPKYMLPPKFQKHLILYNFHRPSELAGEKGLILVEGFFDTMKLWQAGCKNAVALMGTSLSDEQAQLLIEALSPDGTLILMLDPDEPGISTTKEIAERLITKLYIKVIDLRVDGIEADRLPEERIRELLGTNAP
ncbi:CHC2 zinc finger domain-containing protein [Candidatus Poribacteria bacterium]